MTVHQIQSNEEFNEALKKHQSVIIDFFAIWCGPCKLIAPLYSGHSDDKKYQNIYFTKIDVDMLSSLADDLDIQAMPTLVLFKDGKKADVLVDPNPEALQEFVEKGL